MFLNEIEHFPRFVRYMEAAGTLDYTDDYGNKGCDKFNILFLEMLGKDVMQCYQFHKEVSY